MIKLKELILEDNFPKYLWHGSIEKYNILKPHQATDIGGAKGSNQNAVYATDRKDIAIQIGLFTKDSDIGIVWDSANSNPKIVLYKGKIRHGKKVYLHLVPSDTFKKGGSDHEFFSHEEVIPVKIEEINVDDYLHLMRTPTKKDLEFRKRYN